MNNSKIQVIIQIENEDDLESALRAYQIDDFVNAIDEILKEYYSYSDPVRQKISDILEKHDILKFFT